MIARKPGRSLIFRRHQWKRLSRKRYSGFANAGTPDPISVNCYYLHCEAKGGISFSFRQGWQFSRPYVFVLLAASLYGARQLLGWRRPFRLFGLTWAIAFICKFSLTREGIPFWDYIYRGSTEGRELYIFNLFFIDSLSGSFLLFASFCVTLVFVLRHGKMAEQRGRLFDGP